MRNYNSACFTTKATEYRRAIYNRRSGIANQPSKAMLKHKPYLEDFITLDRGFRKTTQKLLSGSAKPPSKAMLAHNTY